jgi:transketolase
MEPALRGEFQRRLAGELPEGWKDALDRFKQAAAEAGTSVATRVASQQVLEVLVEALPELLGGSADLTGSNGTRVAAHEDVSPGHFGGRYLRYGVREHGMAAAMNGLALHGGFIPYGGTFLVFTDYCRPSIRLSALMAQRVIYVMTHDSIGVGEDGPTHQPVEHLASLRAMPNLRVFRPADTVETAECWALALESKSAPSVLVLSRQKLPLLRSGAGNDNLCAAGGYVLAPADGRRQVSLIASGSEVAIAIEAQARLKADGIAAAVVSMPCWELFEAQHEDYRDEVLGTRCLRVAIEAAAGFGWERWIGADGLFIGMHGFGASAPAADLYQHFGITPAAVVATVKARLSQTAS